MACCNGVTDLRPPGPSREASCVHASEQRLGPHQARLATCGSRTMSLAVRRLSATVLRQPGIRILVAPPARYARSFPFHEKALSVGSSAPIIWPRNRGQRCSLRQRKSGWASFRKTTRYYRDCCQYSHLHVDGHKSASVLEVRMMPTLLHVAGVSVNNGFMAARLAVRSCQRTG